MENTNQNKKLKQNELNPKKRKEMTQRSDSHAFPGKLLTIQHKGVVVQCDTCTKKNHYNCVISTNLNLKQKKKFSIKTQLNALFRYLIFNRD